MYGTHFHQDSKSKRHERSTKAGKGPHRFVTALYAAQRMTPEITEMFSSLVLSWDTRRKDTHRTRLSHRVDLHPARNAALRTSHATGPTLRSRASEARSTSSRSPRSGRSRPRARLRIGRAPLLLLYVRRKARRTRGGRARTMTAGRISCLARRAVAR